jgi:hypothetical protein
MKRIMNTVKQPTTHQSRMRLRDGLPSATLLLAAILTMAGGVASAQQHVVVRKPPAGRGFMCPNNGGIWSWGDEILVMYINGPHKNGTGCGSHSTQEGAVGTTYDVSRSLDGGVTWGDHRVAFKRYTKPCGYPAPAPVKMTTALNFTDPNTIVHFQRDDEGLTYLYYSTDKGANWNGPYNNIPKFKEGIHGRTNYEVTGQRSMTAYMELQEDPSTAASIRYPSYAVKTTDGGVNWTLGPMISATEVASGKKVEWDTHPSVARVDAKTLIASFRSGSQGEQTWTRTGWFDLTRSTDNGQTWLHLIRLGESPGNNSCPTTTQVVTLPNGKKRVVTLMWLRPPDKTSCERSKLFARYSDDKGDTWSDVITLRDDVFGWDTGYPIATVRADGKIVVCYWLKTVNQDEPNYIGATIWDAASFNLSSPPALASSGVGKVETAPRRLIASGWDVPTPARFRAEVAAFEQWGIQPQQIGMVGFSAGGHLAIATATSFDRRRASR